MENQDKEPVSLTEFMPKFIKEIEVDEIKINSVIKVPEQKSRLDIEIEELESKLNELKKQKVQTQFTRLPIQRNQELLKNLFETVILDDGFLLGGFARVCVSTNSEIIPSGDIDIYTKGKEQFDLISKRLEMNGWFETRKSETARTMQRSFSGSLPVQLIMPLVEGHILLSSENVEDILNNFDFSIARVGITRESLNSNEAIADVDFQTDDSKKHLNIKNIHCPIAQIYRVSKYMEKGFWLPMKQALKIVKDWEVRPIEYKNKILETVEKEDPTEEEIQQLERLLHID